MSRSYKHYPFCKDVRSSKWGKRVCNKRIRKHKAEMPRKSNIHKKMNEKWDFIYDYCSSDTWEEYKKWVEIPRFWKENEKANYWDWYRWYKRK